MKYLFIGFVFLVLGLFLCSYNLESNINTFTELDEIYEKELQNYEACLLIKKASTISELEQARQRASKVEQKDKLLSIIGLKKSLVWFDEAENYLRQAIEIESAVTDGSTAPGQLHSLTVKKLDEAIERYEKARVEIEKIKEIADPNFNYSLNYLKGEIYYRFLELIADKETAPEMFNQTVTYYKYALRYKPNDVNTVINIELLIKNQNGLTGNNDNPESKKKKMLNSKKFGINKSSGN